MANLVITPEVAMNIIAKKTQVHAPEDKICNHRVGEQPFYWEGTGEVYYIVNTDLTTVFLHAQAKDLFNQGKFQEATNKGLSFRASVALAEELRNCLSSTARIEYREVDVDGEKEQALLITKMVPTKATRGVKVSMEGFGVEEVVQPDPAVKKAEEQLQGA